MNLIEFIWEKYKYNLEVFKIYVFKVIKLIIITF